MEEIWKACSDKYEVSNCGQVRHIRHKRILKHSISTNGYCQVNIGKCQDVHKLVAEVFLGKRPAGYEIHHKDNNRKNPQLSNLEYLERARHKKMMRKLEYKPCPICGDDIPATRRSCSSKCGKELTERDSYVDRICFICGNLFRYPKNYLRRATKNPLYKNPGKYCSNKCRYSDKHTPFIEQARLSWKERQQPFTQPEAIATV